MPVEEKRVIYLEATDKASVRRKRTEFIDSLNTSKHPPSVVSIGTGIIAPQSANVNQE
ncbi:hypothetical protein DPMN_096133 [Dreissena polymorpha]|uniref:Uncharacterized protein n=1 Tax=Dreissena polymorpha TaxID=45954 RepID=A0A9D4R475_DREPO|nr:hypothetical protein DPMN_096133 [Dreissena polymorpha]